MRAAVIGSGGREHALVWRLAQDLGSENVFCLPGNGGIPGSHEFEITDVPALVDELHRLRVDLVVIGPEAPLTLGLADTLRARGFATFGPGAAGARMESSKVWAKDFMRRHGVATASCEMFDSPSLAARNLEHQPQRLVVKYDGLAGGKGVFVCGNHDEAMASLMVIESRYGSASPVILEEFLEGQELSLLAVTDGDTVVLLPTAQDHKQLLDNDEGPNTGGMGAFCPVPWVTPQLMTAIETQVVQPTIRGLRNEKIPYCGVIYFGLMITDKGPRLLEYNARFGDPEAEVLLPKIGGSFASMLKLCCQGRLSDWTPTFEPGYVVDVVLVSGGYPDQYPTGLPITGLDLVPENTIIFHSGTRRHGHGLVTSGGRVLNVVCRGATLDEALSAVYKSVPLIHFEGKHYRNDIGRRPVKN